MKINSQVAIKKEKQKKFLFFNLEEFLGFLFFFIVLISCIWIVIAINNWVNDPERVVLSKLILTGDNSFTKKNEIQKAILSLGLPNTYSSQNVDDIRQEIMRLPWIKEVSIRKQWPDELIINVLEYKPAYIWNDTFFLDKNGVIFSVPKERFNKFIPKLSGPVGKEMRMLHLYQQLDAQTSLNKNGFNFFITEAKADDRDEWNVKVEPCYKANCDDRTILLKLGREKILDRYQRFLKFYPEIKNDLFKKDQLLEADLRYEYGISIKTKK